MTRIKTRTKAAFVCGRNRRRCGLVGDVYRFCIPFRGNQRSPQSRSALAGEVRFLEGKRGASTSVAVLFVGLNHRSIGRSFLEKQAAFNCRDDAIASRGISPRVNFALGILWSQCIEIKVVSLTVNYDRFVNLHISRDSPLKSAPIFLLPFQTDYSLYRFLSSILYLFPLYLSISLLHARFVSRSSIEGLSRI